ncbi:hypothetical protein Salat_1459300 [Sesamum alatum]|uniref:Uncharacterized protein n=1 Tax=Sesamum alatum TaxID=300844 RepID=A0AAE2CLS7_9LAMI|nr:hypothetical protein Salat_1459300 [Sesamum alatum]
MKKKLERYEEALKEMRAEWIQSVGSGIEPLGSGTSATLERYQKLFCSKPELVHGLALRAAGLATMSKASEIQHLKGFKEDFNVSQLDLRKEERLEPRLYSLLPPEAMHPFIMTTCFNPVDYGTLPNAPAEVGEPSSQPTDQGNAPLLSNNDEDVPKNTEEDVPPFES